MKQKVITSKNLKPQKTKQSSNLVRIELLRSRAFMLNFDGGGNPGMNSGYGWVIAEPGSPWEVVDSECGGLGMEATSNTAEYKGLIHGLQACLKLGIKEVIIYGDSQLVIYQITGKYKCHKPHLEVLRNEVLLLLREFKAWNAIWIPREENMIADMLSTRGRKLWIGKTRNFGNEPWNSL